MTNEPTPEDLAACRKLIADDMRKMADEIEAGKIPAIAVTYGQLCDECTQWHLGIAVWTEKRAQQSDMYLLGALDWAGSQIRSSLQQRELMWHIDRAQARQQAATATKQ